MCQADERDPGEASSPSALQTRPSPSSDLAAQNIAESAIRRRFEYSQDELASLRSENDRLRKALEQDRAIAELAHSIFSHGCFRAETFNEVVIQELYARRGTPIAIVGDTRHPKADEIYLTYLSDLEDTKNQRSSSEERSDIVQPAALSQPDNKYREEDPDDGLIV